MSIRIVFTCVYCVLLHHVNVSVVAVIIITMMINWWWFGLCSTMWTLCHPTLPQLQCLMLSVNASWLAFPPFFLHYCFLSSCVTLSMGVCSFNSGGHLVRMWCGLQIKRRWSKNLSQFVHSESWGGGLICGSENLQSTVIILVYIRRLQSQRRLCTVIHHVINYFIYDVDYAWSIWWAVDTPVIRPLLGQYNVALVKCDADNAMTLAVQWAV